tara:strand:- start:24 stop:254 length:231 start_codon:yes stop_codon:yes gene_type:complete
MADEETVVEEVTEEVEVDHSEEIAKLTAAKEELEVPSYGDDLEDEALEAAVASYDVAMESYNTQIAKLDARLAEIT